MRERAGALSGLFLSLLTTLARWKIGALAYQLAAIMGGLCMQLSNCNCANRSSLVAVDRSLQLISSQHELPAPNNPVDPVRFWPILLSAPQR
jgi:hypothetical protein